MIRSPDLVKGQGKGRGAISQRPQVLQSCSITRAAPTITDRNGDDGPVVDASATSNLIAPNACRRQMSVAAIDKGSESILAASAYRRAASPSPSMIASQVSDHDEVQSPREASSALDNLVTFHTSKPNTLTKSVGPPTDEQWSGLAIILTLIVCVLASWALVYGVGIALTAFALSVMS